MPLQREAAKQPGVFSPLSGHVQGLKLKSLPWPSLPTHRDLLWPWQELQLKQSIRSLHITCVAKWRSKFILLRESVDTNPEGTTMTPKLWAKLARLLLLTPLAVKNLFCLWVERLYLVRVQHTQNSLGSVLAAPGPSCGAWKHPAQPWKRQAAPWSTPCCRISCCSLLPQGNAGTGFVIEPIPHPVSGVKLMNYWEGEPSLFSASGGAVFFQLYTAPRWSNFGFLSFSYLR